MFALDICTYFRPFKSLLHVQNGDFGLFRHMEKICRLDEKLMK